MPRRRKDAQQSDMDQIVDEVEIDEDGQPEAEEMVVDTSDDDEVAEDKDGEGPEEEDGNSDLDALSDFPGDQQEMGPATQPRLRIKLKLSAQQTAVSTPDEDPAPSSRRIIAREIDIESEDQEDEVEDEDEEEEEEEDAQSTRSTSVATAGTNKALTARQAVLANVVDASHVSLGPTPNSRKKKPLTEMELALKREETARKRRNLTEKKLEDEKTETINRLLKKQTRARGKRNALATAEDRPSTGGGGDDAEEGAEAEPPEAVIPTMYRWVSTSRMPAQGAEGETTFDKTMSLSFSVPVSVLPPSKEQSESASAAMDVDKPTVTERPKEQTQATCDVQGCSELRKYRLVRGFTKGACGMAHLKALEAQLA